MTTRRFYLATICLAWMFADGPATEKKDVNDFDFFESRIRPVFIKHCYKCHSADTKQPKGGLRLDDALAVKKGGNSGAIIVAGDPKQSSLIQALRYRDLKMPPEAMLPDNVIEDFEKWVATGAPDPRVAKSANHSNEQTRAKSWAFQPLSSPSLPNLSDSNWPTSKLDMFVLAQIESNNEQPSQDVESGQLLRRLYFDLTGLPPTLDDVRQFDRTNLEAVVDELLASQHFGERWGRHWLDLVRYSESNGGDRNVIWPHAWRYRDWVIDALNDDKPYDQFVREQIAGDLIDADDETRDERLVATGMLAMGSKLFMETKSERFRMDRVDEQIDVVTRSVLGLTVSCARCHDHKFDPIPTRDYYALAGIFRNTYLLYGPAAPAGNQYGHDRPLQPIGKDAEKLKGPADAHLKAVADQIAVRNKARSDRYRVVRKKAAQQNKLKMLSEKQSKSSEIAALEKEIAELEKEIKEWDEKVKKLDEELKTLEDNPPPFPDYAMSVRDDETIEDCRIRIGGDFNRNGDVVARGFLSALNGPQHKINLEESGRLQLANWLTDRSNPLTARVAANRVWLHLFGKGIVESVDNFGATGQRPTNPQLLDFLATRLIEHNWSIKKLIREIVLSRAYRMRAEPRRLDAEPLRDSMLAVSGQLARSRRVGSIVSTIAEREFNQRVILTDEQLESPHRSIYLPVVRNWLPKIMAKFDFADPSLVVARRATGSKHAQQLFLLNNSFVAQQSELAAGRLIHSAETMEGRIELAFQLFFSRNPSPVELRQASEFISRNDSDSAWNYFCHALFASAEFRYVE